MSSTNINGIELLIKVPQDDRDAFQPGEPGIEYRHDGVLTATREGHNGEPEPDYITRTFTAIIAASGLADDPNKEILTAEDGQDMVEFRSVVA